jgi:hypothetical protein
VTSKTESKMEKKAVKTRKVVMVQKATARMAITVMAITTRMENG